MEILKVLKILLTIANALYLIFVPFFYLMGPMMALDSLFINDPHPYLTLTIITSCFLLVLLVIILVSLFGWGVFLKEKFSERTRVFVLAFPTLLFLALVFYLLVN
jgi:hypothetical protein